MTAARAWSRLLVCVLGLALADQAVVPLLRRAEAQRYESNRQMRFENSDLFMLGPLTDYLLEHPKGERPRAAFFGKPQACLRASPLVKKHGWGIHHDADGRVAAVAVEGADYAKLKARGDLKQTVGMRSKR